MNSKKNEKAVDLKPFNYTYPFGMIKKSIMLLTDALCSLRGTVKCFKIFDCLSVGRVPSHVSVQNWMLQYGLYELSKPIEKRDDWIYILDHTIEFGTQKCLLILGVTMETLRAGRINLRHQDVRVLKIEIKNKNNAQSVKDALSDVIAATGIPIQIVSDHGSDIKKGIENICEEYPDIRYSYDITHKCALMLKHHLKDDKRWKSYVQNYAHTKRKTVHTKFAYLAPPKPKEKARWLNLDLYVNWAERIILYRENIQIKSEHGDEKNNILREFDSMFGWVNSYKGNLKNWQSILNVLQTAKNEVKNKGLRKNTAEVFQKSIGKLNINSSTAGLIADNLYDFLLHETEAVQKGEIYLGTSDIIESVFGKYKSFSAKTPIRDIGKTILTIPVFTGELTTEKLSEAMSSVSMKTVTKWIKDNIGTTLFSKRLQAYQKTT